MNVRAVVDKLLLLMLLIFLFGGCATTPREHEKPAMSPTKGTATGSHSFGAFPEGISSQEIQRIREGRRLAASLEESLRSNGIVDRRDADRLTEIFPEIPNAWALAGMSAMSEGDYQAAEYGFLRALELDPANSEALLSMGEIALIQKDLTGAEDYFEKAYRRSPTPAAANRLAILQIRLGHLERARTVLSKTLAAFPEDIMTRNNLAVSMDMMGATTDALHLLPEDETVDHALLNTRALLRLKEGQPDGAEHDIRNARPEGNDMVPWLLLGTADLQRGRIREAEVKFRQAVERAPGQPEGYINLGLSLRRQGKFFEARDVYLEGVRRAPHYDLHLNLGILDELYRGDFQEALLHYREYIGKGGPVSDRVKGWVAYLEGVMENQ